MKSWGTRLRLDMLVGQRSGNIHSCADAEIHIPASLSNGRRVAKRFVFLSLQASGSNLITAEQKNA